MRRPHRSLIPILVAALGCVLAAGEGSAADWPMWRCDASRSASSPEDLPDELHLEWVLTLPTPRPAWPTEQRKLQFDAWYEPIVLGSRLIVPSMTRDSVAAYDVADGKELWRFYAAGPVRFAPVGRGERVWFASDDGYLYCLNAATGSLVWKFRGGPRDKLGLGNDRMISQWPARGAPVLHENTVYFAAGVWPFMGIFLHALDAETGKVRWTNSGTGSEYLVQPHGSPAFAGVAPQGYLTICGDMLLVSGGRTVPAAFDRRTGKFLFYQPGKAAFGKDTGGYEVFAGEGWFAHRGAVFFAAKGDPGPKAQIVAADRERVWLLDRGELVASEPKLILYEHEGLDRSGNPAKLKETIFPELFRVPLAAEIKQVHLRAGGRFYGSDGRDRIFACDVPDPTDDTVTPKWQRRIQGRVGSMLAGAGRLFVSTRDGWIYCYGPERREVKLPELAARAGDERVVAFGESWRYLNDGSTPASGWLAAKFNDRDWKQGPADLAGQDEDKSVIPKLPMMAAKTFVTTYYRRTLDGPDVGPEQQLRLRVKTSEGFLVTLNAREVARRGLPPGAVKPDTLALPHEAGQRMHEILLPAAALHAQENCLAVEVHRAAKTGGAVNFDLELTALGAPEEDMAAKMRDLPPPMTPPALAAEALLRQAGTREGFALVLDWGDGKLVQELVERSLMHIVVLEREPAAAEQARRELETSDDLGERVHVLQGDLAGLDFPAYFANIIVCHSAEACDGRLPAQTLAQLWPRLRPYGGTLVVDLPNMQREEWLEAGRAIATAEANHDPAQDWFVLRRPGAPPGSAPWTHHNADAGNSLVAPDGNIRAPLGLLWFGGPSHDGVLPRHGHGPTPLVVGGRLIIEGADMLRAVDVYTGRLLWQKTLPTVGQYYDNTAHHPGAAAIGSNYVAVPDAIYVALGRRCLKLDPATGLTQATFTLPEDGKSEPPLFSTIWVSGKVLLAACSPVASISSTRFQKKDDVAADYAEASRRIVALDRQTGAVLWSRDAQFAFRHNGIALGGERVYCLDRLTETQLGVFKRRGIEPEGRFTLTALDLATGTPLWETADNVFGTWLGYSREHDLVLQAGSASRDRAKDEATKGLVAYQAATGKPLWQSDAAYAGPCLLRGEWLITQSNAFQLLTGRPLERTDPVTGKEEQWKFSRNYGCNTVIGCTNLLTFRSAAAGYFDLAGDGGTGNLGGFRSSCTSNLIPADGVLSAPDYTRTCTCAYQQQCSLAFVHDPSVEVWTFNTHSWEGERVRRVGLNFGAPGDRRDEQGTLWLDIPSTGGTSPKVPVEIVGKEGAVSYVRQHVSQVVAAPLPWVAASAVRGAEKIKVRLIDEKKLEDEERHPRHYTVRLHFADLVSDNMLVAPPAPVQHVRLQGDEVLRDFDVRREAGGSNRGIVREFRGIEVGELLELDLRPAGPAPTSLSGIELILEE